MPLQSIDVLDCFLKLVLHYKSGTFSELSELLFRF